MRHFLGSVFPLSGLALLLAACAGAPTVDEPRTPRPALSESAEALLADSIADAAIELFDTWGRLEPDPFLSLFAEDGEFYIEGARWTRAELEEAVRGIMPAVREQGWEAEVISGPHVEVLGADAAVASFLYEGEDETAPDGTLTWAWCRSASRPWR